jgi:putative methionine-R-sulfoxide reductase with GAF domain
MNERVWLDTICSAGETPSRDLSDSRMDTYPTLDKNPSQAAPGIAASSHAVSKPAGASAGAAAAPAMARETLRFPGEDGGKSLSEMAQRDLDATLQLLVERAQYITGASGVAIALREGENMVCCASAGPSAPGMGTHLQIDSGLSAESVRTRQTLHCDDAENDPRVNQESCRAFGIASVVVMPLVRGEEVYGVFELLAGRPRAFEERDFIALQRLSEMIQTAVDLAEAARRAEKEFGASPEPAFAAKAETAAKKSGGYPIAGGIAALVEPAVENDPALAQAKAAPTKIREATTKTKTAETMLSDTALAEIKLTEPRLVGVKTFEGNPPAAEAVEVKAEELPVATPINSGKFGKVRSCVSCGFPISEGRRLCLDCEAASPSVDSVSEAPEPFGEMLEPEPSWIRSHVYLVATAVLVVATIAVVVWRF